MQHRSSFLLALIFLLSLFLRLFRLGLDGFSNLYYAATVGSMLTGWHNFLFASFDPAGFVSVDKPPLGFWVQALSAAVFGFQGWALVLPQALAGALSVLVMYLLVKRVFGSQAGLLAALILAITPISVATHRSNTPDGQLLLLLLLAALFASRAAESGKFRWLAASAVLVGFGFNIKMLQAYLVLPAFFFFLPPPIPLLKRLGQLSGAMVMVFALSFAWIAAVDLTPAAERPYVGSTGTNHVIELVAVHNGVRRLGPIAGWFGIHPKDSAVAAAPAAASASASAPPAPSQASISTAQTTSVRAWPDGGLPEVGEPGPLRMFNPQLAAQVSWLLPMALLALVSGAARASWKHPLDREALFYILWAGWLLPALFFFSFGGLIHRYYLDMLAPPVAALCAAGLVSWKDDLLHGRWTGWLLPISLAGTAVWAFFIIGYHPEMRLLAWLTLALGSAAVVCLLIYRTRAGQPWMFAVLLPALLAAPLVWSTTPMWKGGDVILPFAGPDLLYWGGHGDVLETYSPLAQFLTEQHTRETFLVAAPNAVVAAPLQLLTGQPVMAMGGFTGTDPILTIGEFTDLFTAGRVRYVLEFHKDPLLSERIAWLSGHCQLVDFSPIPENMDLYDCAPR